MAKTFEQLKTQTEQIKNETQDGANTSERVGGTMSDIVETTEAEIDSSATTINANTGVSDYPVFSTSKSYAVGDIVMYDGLLYKFTVDHAAGVWNVAHVEQTSMDSELNGKITELEAFACIKELYLIGITNIDDYYIGNIRKTESEYILQIQRKIDDTVVCLSRYNKKVGIKELSESNESGIYGYCIIDWSKVPEESLTKIEKLPSNCLDLDSNPSIKNYLSKDNISNNSMINDFIIELYIENTNDDEEYGIKNILVDGNRHVVNIARKSDSEIVMGVDTSDSEEYNGVMELIPKINGTNERGYIIVDWNNIFSEQNVFEFNKEVVTNINYNPIIQQYRESLNYSVIYKYGYYIDKVGSVIENNNWKYTNQYIPIESIIEFKISLYKGALGIAYYDNNFNFISGKEGTGQGVETITETELDSKPENAVYVRFSIENREKNDYIVSSSYDSIPDNIKNLFNNFNEQLFISNYYISTDGLEIPYNEYWKCTTQYIPIESVVSFNISLWLRALGIAYYDNDFNFISGKEGTGQGLETITETELDSKPENAVYVRFSLRKDDGSNLNLNNNSIYECVTESDAENYKKLRLQSSNKWYGKRCAFIGDSITDKIHVGTTKNYWQYMEDILGVVSVSYGQNGAQSSVIINQATSAKNDEEENGKYDAIFILMGTNDFNASVPIGDWYSVEDKETNKNGQQTLLKYREFVTGNSTFKSRLNTGLQYIKTNFPDAQIIIMTPLHRGFAEFEETNIQPDESYANVNGDFISDFVDAVKESANVWSINLIDLNSISGIFPNDDAYVKYFHDEDTDRLHPNANGHYRMAQAICAQMNIIPPLSELVE